jgi:hypothetical protein
MPENEASKNWLKKIIVILFITGLQLVNFIDGNISMVNLKFELVKVKSNRTTGCSVVTQSPLESPSLTNSKFMFINGIVEVKSWLISQDAVNYLVISSILKIGQNWKNQNLTAEDLIHLDLGDPNGIRKFWKPGLVEKITTSKHTNEADKKAGKQSSTRRTLKASIDNQKWSKMSFGPEYSSDNAGDGPVGKTV